MKIPQLNIIIAVSALLAIFTQMQNELWLFTIFKPLTTIFVISIVVVYAKRELPKFRMMILAGLCACLLGDVFLLKEEFFVLGLSSFLVAHMLFTVAFTQLGGFKFRWPPLMILLLLACGYFWYLSLELGELILPVAIYNLVIVVMAWQAICLALWKPVAVSYALAAASLLFMFSDSMIALNKFMFAFDASGAVILSTYWISITIIANVSASDKLGNLLMSDVQ